MSVPESASILLTLTQSVLSFYLYQSRVTCQSLNHSLCVLVLGTEGQRWSDVN